MPEIVGNSSSYPSDGFCRASLASPKRTKEVDATKGVPSQLKQEIASECARLTGRLKAGPVSDKRAAADHPRMDLDDISIIYNPKTQEYTYMCAAPPIKNLVISGGGAKGTILPGVFRAFEAYKTESGSFRDQIENVAGSSVGALSAALFAAGMSSDQLVAATGGVDFKALLGKGIGPILKDGQPLEDFTRRHLTESMSMQVEKIFGVEKLQDVTPEMVRSRGLNDRDTAKLLEFLFECVKSSGNKPRITFSMLATLHKLDAKVFKNLTVTGTCRENGKTFYFDAENTPDLDIALACRASASLPLFLKPVVIDRRSLSPGYAKELGKREELTFVDGGYLDNIPVEAMHHKQKEGLSKGEQGQNLQTLALVFDETEIAKDSQSSFLNVHVKPHAIYNSSNFLERLTRDVFAKIFGRINTKERNTIKKEQRLNEMPEKYPQRHIPLRVPGIRTRDFNKAKRSATELQEQGYKQGMEYLALHDKELTAHNFDSLEEILELVPRDKQEKMQKQIEDFRKKIDSHDWG